MEKQKIAEINNHISHMYQSSNINTSCQQTILDKTKQENICMTCTCARPFAPHNTGSHPTQWHTGERKSPHHYRKSPHQTHKRVLLRRDCQAELSIHTESCLTGWCTKCFQANVLLANKLASISINHFHAL